MNVHAFLMLFKERTVPDRFKLLCFVIYIGWVNAHENEKSILVDRCDCALYRIDDGNESRSRYERECAIERCCYRC